MTITVMELTRAHKLLQSFCERRSVSSGSNAQLSCQQEGDSLLLVEVGGRERPLVKLDYRDGRWFLFWSQKEAGWQPWPYLSEAESVQAIVDELEQAPLHVHW